MKKAVQWLMKALPHINIVISGMYIVLFIIDVQNSAMALINNDITKVLLLILSVGSIVSAALLIWHQRRDI